MSATLTAEPPVRYPPGDLAIWIFILAELAVFAILDLLPFPACGARYGDSGGGGAEDAPRRLFRERAYRHGDRRCLLAYGRSGVAHPLPLGLRDAMNTVMKMQIAMRPCTRVYLLLVVLTVVTFAIGHFDLLSGGRALVLSLLVLGFALIKGQLIGDFFMGLKGVRGPWRFVILLWLLIPGTLITIAFTLAG